MCVLLVCLCAVSPGQGRDASQDEYVESLSETSEYETAAVDRPGITAPKVKADEASSSVSLGKSFFFANMNRKINLRTFRQDLKLLF